MSAPIIGTIVFTQITAIFTTLKNPRTPPELHLKKSFLTTDISYRVIPVSCLEILHPNPSVYLINLIPDNMARVPLLC